MPSSAVTSVRLQNSNKMMAVRAGIPENRFRLWSNASMWPNSRVPVDGDNVTIKKEWKVILDMNPAKMNYFYVKGTLIIPDEINDIVI